MKKLSLVLSLTVVLIFSGSKGVRAEDEFQYWSLLTLNFWKGEKTTLWFHSQGRWTNATEDLGLFFFSPRVRYALTDHIDLGLNYTYLRNKRNDPSAGRSPLHYQHRAELEFNPHWKVGDWLKIYIRNRMEYRWIEDRGSDNTRFRQRWAFTFPLKNAGRLEAVFLNSEFFYDRQRNDYVENRTIPLGLSFRVNEKVSFEVFHLIQSQKGGRGDWSSNQIFGTHVKVKF